MHSDYAIRFARLEDAGPVSTICKEGFTYIHQSGFWGNDLEIFCAARFSEAAIREDMALADRFYLVLEQDKQIVGCLRMAPPDLQLAMEDAQGFELSRFYVLDGHRSGGWGTRMLQQAHLTIACMGYRRCWLHVYVPNKPAQQFYLRAGYQYKGEEQLIYRNSHPNGYVMAKELDLS